MDVLVLEAVQWELQTDPAMTWIFELTPPAASNAGLPVINLETEFGRKRVVNTGIDENWMCSAILGAGLAVCDLYSLSRRGITLWSTQACRLMPSHPNCGLAVPHITGGG